MQNNRVYVFGPFRLNAAERRLTCEGEPIALARKVFDLLLLLVESAGHLMTRGELIEALWPRNVVEEQGLTTKLHVLRKALGDDGEAPRYIETVRGVGYRFIAAVRLEDPPAEADAPRGGADSENGEKSASSRSAPRPKRLAAVAIAMLLIVAGILAWRLPPWGAAQPAASDSGPSIAVLPFKNLSDEQSSAYFAAGIRDTILTRLAELHDLRVISRSASDAYGSNPGSVREAARELDVDTVLEGSVQKAGSRVLINVRLINARDHAQVWAATYTRTLADIFEVEGEVATRVAGALQNRLRPTQRARLATPPTRDPKAYVLYLKANYNARRAFDIANAPDPQAAVKEATSLYRRAIERDPKFALAWARLSLLDSSAWWFGFDATPHRKAAAIKAARRAIALAPDLPQARIALGYAYYYGTAEFDRALAQFRRARKALPHDADVVGAMAYVHRRQDQWRKALAELGLAARLDPRNPRWHDEAGITLMALRRYDEAEREFHQALAIAPDDYDARMRLIRLLILTGRTSLAGAKLAELPADKGPEELFSSLRFKLAWLARRPDAALAVLDGAPRWEPKAPLRADVWKLEGDKARARQGYDKARDRLRSALEKEPDNADLWAALGLAEAGLSNRAAALEAGRHATRLYPISRDVMAGPQYLLTLAKIHSLLGETAPATELLGRLLAMPAGMDISVPLLRLDPVWDPLRDEPGFQALLKQYGLSARPLGIAPTAAASAFHE